MTQRDIEKLIIGFWGAFSTALWNFSEGNEIPIGQIAPVVFGLMIDSPGHEVSDGDLLD